jgi:hypothetical protein
MAMVKEDDLVRLWHRRESMAEIAGGLGLSVNSLRHEWNRLKRAGKLPALPRPVDNYRPVEGVDGRPTVGGDPLLERLFEVHGDPRWDLYGSMS